MEAIRNKSRQDFYDIVARKGGILHGEYVNNSTNVEIECGICHGKWNVTPNSIKRGAWCRACSGNCQIAAEKKFRDIVESRGGKIHSGYVTSRSHVTIECSCGNIWNITPSRVKNGSWCPRCSKVCPHSAKKDFLEHLEYRGGTLLSEYVNTSTKVKIQCHACSNIWSVIPSSVKMGHWCPSCVDLSPEKAMNNFMKVLEERGGTLCSEYNGATNYVNILCHKCGNNWNVEPHSVLRRNWCPKCKQSRGEYSIMSWLKKYPNEVLYQTQYKFEGDRHAYDFLLYYNNMHYLVEFDGIQHFEYICHFHKTEERFKERIKADIFKNELASYNNIPLLRISYLELEYVEQWLEYFLLNPYNIMYSNPELYTKTYALTQ